MTNEAAEVGTKVPDMERSVVYQVVQRSANADLKQAAAFLGVCGKTVLNLANKKVLHKVKIGRRTFFRWGELEKLAKHGTR